MNQTGIVLRPLLPAWALAVLTAALVLLAVWAYRPTTRAVALPFKALLIGLRLAAAAALLLCLLRPAIETTTYTVEKRPLVFLIDESRSMSCIQDAAGGLSRLDAVMGALRSNPAALDALHGKYDVRMLSFAGEVFQGQDRTESATSYSAYGRALEDALESCGLGECDGVVLVGDGSHNLDPPDPLDVVVATAERGIPIYIVGVGREEAGQSLRDVKVLSLEVPRKAFVFTTFTVRGRILARGCSGSDVRVRLEFPDHEMQFQALGLGHDEEVVPVEFQLAPQRLGEFKITMRVQELEDEMLLANNVRSAFVRVVSSGLMVGYFDGLRPESKFVLRALQGARQVNVQPVIVMGRRKLSPGEADWDRYDVVMLGNVPAASLEGGDLAALKAAVLEGAKGLVLLAGEHSAGPGGFGDTFLENVLPVELPRRWQYISGERQFRVEPAAAGSPILAIGGSAADTPGRWQSVPALSGVVAGARPKAGAQVLARDQDGHPLLCVQRAGAGRAACVLTDTTFRWFFTEADTQADHQRFWRQLALWAGGMDQKPAEEFRIELSRTEVGVGEHLGIQAHLASPGGEPVREAKVTIVVERPDGESSELQGLFSRQEGCFEADYVPPVGGEYVVRARALRGGKPVGTDAAFFQASSVDRELEDPVANLSLLRRIAAATAEGGAGTVSTVSWAAFY